MMNQSHSPFSMDILSVVIHPELYDYGYYLVYQCKSFEVFVSYEIILLNLQQTY